MVYEPPTLVSQDAPHVYCAHLAFPPASFLMAVFTDATLSLQSIVVGDAIVTCVDAVGLGQPIHTAGCGVAARAVTRQCTVLVVPAHAGRECVMVQRWGV